MKNQISVICLSTCLIVGAAPGIASEPTSSEFLVNSFSTGNQNRPDVVVLGPDSAQAVWVSFQQDGAFQNATVTRSLSGSAAQGGELIVTPSAGGESNPSLAKDGQGQVIVVWQDSLRDSDFGGIVGQRFDSSGNATGAEFVINTYTTGPQFFPHVSAAPSGEFVVVWQTYDTSLFVSTPRAQLFDAAGTMVGSEIVVDNDLRSNSAARSGSNAEPRTAMNRDGSFVVSWTGTYGSDGSGPSIQARQFASDGSPATGTFQVNSYTTGYQIRSAVAADADSNVLIVWDTVGLDSPTTSGVIAQRYDSTAQRIGSEFVVNAFTTGGQSTAKVAAGDCGEFVIVWQSSAQDGSGFGVFARTMAGDGSLEPEFMVHETTSANQQLPAVATGGGGRFVVLWSNYAVPANGSDVAARWYSFDGIFCDGFELGDTGGWTAENP